MLQYCKHDAMSILANGWNRSAWERGLSGCVQSCMKNEYDVLQMGMRLMFRDVMGTGNWPLYCRNRPCNSDTLKYALAL